MRFKTEIHPISVEARTVLFTAQACVYLDHFSDEITADRTKENDLLRAIQTLQERVCEGDLMAPKGYLPFLLVISPGYLMGGMEGVPRPYLVTGVEMGKAVDGLVPALIFEELEAANRTLCSAEETFCLKLLAGVSHAGKVHGDYASWLHRISTCSVAKAY